MAGTILSQTLSESMRWWTNIGWNINKNANPNYFDLFVGRPEDVQYSVLTVKNSGKQRAYICGYVGITNVGTVPTEGLKSKLEVTSTDDGKVIAEAKLDISRCPVIQAEETSYYYYSIHLDNYTPGSSYKLTANTTITNYEGHRGAEFVKSTSISNVFPKSPTLINQTV